MNFTCTYCGVSTLQAPVIVSDRLYGSCCLDCMLAEKWTALAVCRATLAQLTGAVNADEVLKDNPATFAEASPEQRSASCAVTQWSRDVLDEHRGFKKLPEACRPWKGIS